MENVTRITIYGLGRREVMTIEKCLRDSYFIFLGNLTGANLRGISLRSYRETVPGVKFENRNVCGPTKATLFGLEIESVKNQP